MIQTAKLIRVAKHIEEEVVIQVHETCLKGFATIRPYNIEVGEIYPVELSLFILDYSTIERSPTGTSAEFLQIGDDFSYIITGLLREGCLVVNNVSLEDDTLKEEFSYLDGEMIILRADRIDVEFI